MTVEAERKVLQPQAKACQQPLETGRGEEWIFFCSLQKESAVPTP